MPLVVLHGAARLKKPPLLGSLSAFVGVSKRAAQDGPTVDNASAKVAGFTELRFLAMIFLHPNVGRFCLQIVR
ncbi:MAG TPA: hypothetical protein EYM34_11620 [Alphaproteobacteria bacterium]|nr:hypothetical protein [Alphaproteobacteria bacterium]